MNRPTMRTEHRINRKRFLGITAFGLASVALAALAVHAATEGQDSVVTREQATAVANLQATGKAFAAVAKQVSPAVVFIQVEKTVAVSGPTSTPSIPFNDPFSGLNDEFFGQLFVFGS